ncbi:hypothetical protein J4209_02290 [Candidatus Woesearchaeota archaeon]|nr:hypothetical protein [Candidatus Woesearchaeota archaeon]
MTHSAEIEELKSALKKAEKWNVSESKEIKRFGALVELLRKKQGLTEMEVCDTLPKFRRTLIREEEKTSLLEKRLDELIKIVLDNIDSLDKIIRVDILAKAKADINRLNIKQYEKDEEAVAADLWIARKIAETFNAVFYNNEPFIDYHNLFHNIRNCRSLGHSGGGYIAHKIGQNSSALIKIRLTEEEIKLGEEFISKPYPNSSLSDLDKSAIINMIKQLKILIIPQQFLCNLLMGLIEDIYVWDTLKHSYYYVISRICKEEEEFKDPKMKKNLAIELIKHDLRLLTSLYNLVNLIYDKGLDWGTVLRNNNVNVHTRFDEQLCEYAR